MRTLTVRPVPRGRRRPLFANAPAYRAVVGARIRTAFAYRQQVGFLLALVVIQIFILRKVWTALYDDDSTVNGFSLESMLAYLTLANLQAWVMRDLEVGSYIQSRIRGGHIAFDLLRPAGFVQQMFAHLVGVSVAMAVFAVASLPFIAFAGTLALPASFLAFGWWLVSVALGYVIALLMSLIVGLLSFWTTEIIGVTMLFHVTSQFFAGALVPLSFFPPFLRDVAALMPFQATVYTPASIYVGRLTGEPRTDAVLVQLVWVFLMAGAVKLVWVAARRRAFVQGG